MILGATGTGKPTLKTSLLAFAERFQPHLFALDLDRGMELFIRVIGGNYFALEAGVPTGLNPFQLPDTPTNREFLYELRELMLDKVAEKNGLLVNIIEEFSYALRFKFTEELMLKMLKTDRKRGSWLILVSQSPEDAIKADTFPAIVQQTPTKIFLPNPDAEFTGSYERCGLTLKEYQELIKLSLDSRTFLVKQSKQSAFAKLDLYGFKDEMVFLSGSSDNIELLHEIMAEYGDDVQNWYSPFMEGSIKPAMINNRANHILMNIGVRFCILFSPRNGAFLLPCKRPFSS